MNHYTEAGHSIFAHSRPDKIGTPRLLPNPPHIPPWQGGQITPPYSSPYLRGGWVGLMEYQQKNPLRYYALPFLFEFFNNVHFRLIGFAEAKAMSVLFGFT